MSKQQPDPRAAAARLKRLSRLRPTLAMVLGSGFHHVLSELQVDAEISYAKLPGFPPTGVSGHAGQLFIGHLGGTPVMVLSGRAHYYEGHPMARVTFAVRALAAYGIRDLLLTNAAGGVNRSFRPGDFMVLTDHINLMGVNPLRGGPVPGLPRFVDLTCAYDQGLRRLLRRAGRACGVKTSGRHLPGGQRAELRDAGGDSRVCPARRGRGRHEHGAGGDRGAAMRPEGGRGILHHQPGGGPEPEDPVARRGAGDGGAGEETGSANAQEICETVWPGPVSAI